MSHDLKSLGILNEDEVASRRIPIEDAELTASKKSNWHCTFCLKKFMHENAFMKHHCEPRRRSQELMTPIGQAAYAYYKDWMRLKKFSQPSADAFLTSKYYRSFVSFAELVIKANIQKPEKYIELMIKGDILPVLWCRDSAYSLYLDWTDKLAEPLDQVNNSINFLFDICEKDNVQIGDIFQHLGPQQILSFIRQRSLTPWLLFCSPKFGALLKQLDKAELIAFNAVVNSSYWSARFQKETKVVENIKLITKEIGL